jgi:sucrose phosphorylase
MRDLLDDVAPGTILITETNVPHQENISYFGEGDEAHAVYQFSLAPLLLDAFFTADAGPLTGWLANLEYPGDGMTFFNFTASHDGVGVRPLEGLVTQQRLDALVEGVRERGGLVSTRTKPDGTDAPYELNISYFSALDSPTGLPPEIHAQRFLASQALMLSLRGVPGIYFHSLVGTPNYHDGVKQTGHNRTINRRKFGSAELRAILESEESAQRRVFDGYRQMLKTRIEQPAFHPDGQQQVILSDHSSLVAFLRTSPDEQQQILVLVNVGPEPIPLVLNQFVDAPLERDLLSDHVVNDGKFEVGAFQAAWLV